ncbi:hypothetical protein GJAV_G00224260 [Gymnothorax javanicus]|nr:hypothetical protein GJAV_G00224260 [Gymnothorax javanicus]
MRRKTTAKRILDREYNDEQEGDERHDIDHGLQKRRKHMFPTKESAEENSPPAAGILKLNSRAFEFDGPGNEHFEDGDSDPQEVDFLQLLSKAELIAMVLCMQKEMESLKEQIRCLTACGKLARTLENLVERTQLWSNGGGGTTSPSVPGVPSRANGPVPAVANGQWAEQDAPSPTDQSQLLNGPQKDRHPVFQEFITPELLDRCNTGTTAQKLTNDLLQGMYKRERLAFHSVCGVIYSKRGQAKPALPADEVQAILRAVQHYFPGKTDAEIKGYIRQKMQNEAKRLRRKPHLLGRTEEAVVPEDTSPVLHRDRASPSQVAQSSGSTKMAAVSTCLL